YGHDAANPPASALKSLTLPQVLALSADHRSRGQSSARCLFPDSRANSTRVLTWNGYSEAPKFVTICGIVSSTLAAFCVCELCVLRQIRDRASAVLPGPCGCLSSGF